MVREKLELERISLEDEEHRKRSDMKRSLLLKEEEKLLLESQRLEAEQKLKLDEFETEIARLERDRSKRLSQIEQEAFEQSKEFNALVQQTSKVANEAEEIQFRTLMNNERENAIKRAQERLYLLEKEKNMQAFELE